MRLIHHSVFWRTLFWMLLGFFRSTIHIISAVAVDNEYLMRSRSANNTYHHYCFTHHVKIYCV
jgi:hypothetical protein